MKMIQLGKYISEYSERNKSGEELPVYSVTNSEGFCKDYFSKDVSSQDRTTYKVVPRGYFAYNPSRINVGSVDWQHCEERVIVSPLYVVFKVSDSLDQQYLYYYLKSDKCLYFIKQLASGSVRDNLRFSSLKEFLIPDISIKEQKQVVKTLDHVSNLIYAYKQQLAKLDELVKSRFVELFGDPVDNPKNYLVKSLQELIDMGYITYHLDGNHGGDYPRSEEFVDSGVPYIGANSIVNGEIDFSMAKFLTAERASKLRKGIAQNDDVLFAHNATVGPTVVLKTTESKVILSTSLTAYRCNQSKLLPNFLKAYMQSDGFVRQYSGEMKQTTRNQVPITAQKKYLFLVPPIVEQEQFATFVEQTDKSKLAVKQSLEKLETLKKSLMQQYFG